VAFSPGHPGLARDASRRSWPAPSGVAWSSLTTPSGRSCAATGLSTRRARLGLIAGHRVPYEPRIEPEPEPHIEVERPSELVGVDWFKVGHPRRGLAADRD
jgi:hypothetical protein